MYFFQGNQTDNIYQLSQKPIEENSELVFINGFSQTRDQDYYINYEKGELRFLNKTIPSGQKVEISYNYFSSNTPNKKDVNAYSLESKYAPSKQFNMINKVNIVDPNFLPIGNININKGSSKVSHEFNWNMNQNELSSFKYETETIQDTNYTPLYHKDSYLSKIKFNALVFETEHEIQYDNINSTQNFKETPKKIIKYENKIDYSFSDDNIGLTNTFSQKNEKLSSDVFSRSLVAGSKIMYNNNFKIKNLIKSAYINPYFSINLDKTNAVDTSSFTRKKIENIGFTSSAKITENFNNTTSFDKGIHQTMLYTEDQFQDVYYNYSHVSNIMPYKWINTNINISHEENISPIPGQENKVSDRESYNIIRLANAAALEFIKTPKYIISPLKGSFTNFGYQKTKTRENNQLKNYKEDRYFGSLNALKPIDGFIIPKFKFDSYKTDILDKSENSYQLSNETASNFDSFDTSFTYRPNINHLNRLSFDGSVFQSKSTSIGTLKFTSGTINVTDIKITEDRQNYGMNINLPSIPLWITSITNPVVRLETRASNKRDENRIDSTDNSSDSFLLENNFVSANVYKLNYGIFNTFSLGNSAFDEKSYFNRNKIISSQGSLFRQKRNIDQSISSSFFNFIRNKQYAKFERINQYKNQEINIDQNEIKTNFDNSLKLDERLANHETELSLSTFISVKGKLEYQDFDQTIASKNSATTNEYFNQNTGTAGLIFRPLSGLSIEYDYSIKELKKNTNAKLRGNSDLVKLIYNPIKYENFEVQFNLSREKNWGFGFNTIEKAQLLQSSNETLAIDIISRNDEIYLSSLNLNIIMPINNSEHLEKIIFTGEGYFKKITDNVNPSNSMMINGLLFNVRLEL
tara:strand:- start:906 stop:3494 length:2589 start_codon:yes stop_codon:yes gene_type:complete